MNQIVLFGNNQDNNSPTIVENSFTIIENGEYYLAERLFNKSEGDYFYIALKENINWKQESLKMYGKNIILPRHTAWCSENDKNYTFSGIALNPNYWNKDILGIKS